MTNNMKTVWFQVTPDNDFGSGMWICTVDGVELCGISVNMNTLKYMLFDLSCKPEVRLVTNKEFETISDAKTYVQEIWSLTNKLECGIL